MNIIATIAIFTFICAIRCYDFELPKVYKNIVEIHDGDEIMSDITRAHLYILTNSDCFDCPAILYEY